MKTMADLASSVVTLVHESQTPRARPNTQTWAKWAKFDLEADTEAEKAVLCAMVDATARFCREVKDKRPARWLTFLGNTGTGKTYLAKRIWHWHSTSPEFVAAMETVDGLDEIVYPGQWCYWPAFAGELASNNGYDRLRDLAAEKFVVIDEIGADRDASGHIKDCLARMLCSRVGKWTVITSNRSLADIAEHIDQRIASRIIRDGSEVVECDAADYWLRKARPGDGGA